MLLHKVDEDYRSLVTIVTLENCVEAFERPIVEFDGLAGFKTTLCCYGGKAGANLINNSLVNGCWCIAKSNNP